MGKHFLTKKEQETILAAYSMNFEREFHRVSPYCFGSDYSYTINMVPEIDHEGKETGRILVNHYSYFKAPRFIDVWERDGKELRFLYRNINVNPPRSLEDENRALKAQLDMLLRVHEYNEALKGNLKGKKLSQYCKEITEQRDAFIKAYNDTAARNQAYMREKDEFFRQSEKYYELTVKLDDISRDNDNLKREKEKVEERFKKYVEKIMAGDMPSAHNVRGAGRKKDPKVEEKRQRAIQMKKEGIRTKFILEELGISRATLSRYLKEADSDISDKNE